MSANFHFFFFYSVKQDEPFRKKTLFLNEFQYFYDQKMFTVTEVLLQYIFDLVTFNIECFSVFSLSSTTTTPSSGTGQKCDIDQFRTKLKLLPFAQISTKSHKTLAKLVTNVHYKMFSIEFSFTLWF